MSVDRGHEAETHCSANGLCDLALVDRSQTGLVSVLDTAEGGNVFGHDGEVLFGGSTVSMRSEVLLYGSSEPEPQLQHH